MSLVELRDVHKQFPAPKTARAKGAPPVITVIDGVSLDVAEGEIFGLIGYSGAGKSTLVRLINALTPVTSGSIRVAGREVTTLGEKDLQVLRRDIGMVFQQFNLFNSRTVWGNVSYPLAIAGVPKAERVGRVRELLEFVGLEGKFDAYPDQLSGGQKQRVGIARALATRPRLLLADEATSALDPETTQEVLALLRRVNAEFGTTIIVITHEMEVIRTTATRVAVLDEGQIIEQGPVYDVFSAPQHPTTRKFVATVIQQVPDAAGLARLRAQHPGVLAAFTLREGGPTQGQFFGELGRWGVGFELVHGGIEDIAGQTFGQLVLNLTGDEATIHDALAGLSTRFDVRELA
ncbi:MAG: methionine ABC transporter ATP-binding protein [Propionibacteriaceae bacterium]|jgi:D-methionine transport system ATP-binding protein|nr:methionine ABC transporter ATP-binding protein [Propionibacteriaceae bacterium]